MNALCLTSIRELIIKTPDPYYIERQQVDALSMAKRQVFEILYHV